MKRLAGKAVLITGAANGQGAAEAELFASEGAAVLLTDVDDENGEAVAAKIIDAGGRAIYMHQDVACERDWVAAVDKVNAEFGCLHCLINNAGIVPRASIQDTTFENLEKTLAINLSGPIIGMKHCAPLIRDSGGGSIINVSSAAGLTAHYDAAYTASKWGLRGVTKTAAIEYAPWKIRVNSIHPGQIKDTALFGNASPELAQSLSASIPMQRPGTPVECADLALFLASDESSFITGAEIPIDGGYSAGGTMFLRQQLRDRLVVK